MKDNNRTIPRNIIVFGQTGSGKSSVINMLAGSSVADVSGGAVGSTPSNQSYVISHEDNNVYTFWDTAGLNEAENGTVSSHAAAQNLVDLVNKHGVNLLVYCIRPRLVNIIRVNYELLWKTICREEVPVVLVVTGLEGRDDMDEWWQEAQKPFRKMKMKFTGHACITSTKGRGGMYEMKYKESAEKVWRLVREHSTRNPWYMTPGWSDRMTEDITRTIPRNVVVFGQTGSGKSSMINMLAGGSVATVSDSAVGATPSSQAYDISHRGDDVYTFWDTAGLNEADNGTLSSQTAVQNLLDLVNDHGANLLVYCIRPRLVDMIRVNYDLFWKIICKEKIPVVLVVTGLEGIEDMDEWWRKNEKKIKRMKMEFAGHVCITSTKGKEDMYEMKYTESAEKVWRLVKEHSTRVPWHMEPGWSAEAQQTIVAYEQNYKARSENWIRKILRNLRFF